MVVGGTQGANMHVEVLDLSTQGSLCSRPANFPSWLWIYWNLSWGHDFGLWWNLWKCNLLTNLVGLLKQAH